MRRTHSGGPEGYEQGVKLSRPTDNLPLWLRSFVGGERETAEVARLLADGRLLTLTGPGDSGKTRLALAVASSLAGRFDDGVWARSWHRFRTLISYPRPSPPR
jgi:hypothetical protein